MRFILLASALMMLVACTDSSKKSAEMKAGTWKLNFDISNENENTSISVKMMVDSLGNISIQNGAEIIPFSDIRHKKDSVHARIAPYLSFMHWQVITPDSISGYWDDASRDDYKVNFYATTFDFQDEVKTAWNKTFDVTFAPNTNDQYKAVGIFKRNGNDMQGTFLTETGDFRFLQGRVKDAENNEQITLGCFDGAHLFHFTASLSNDSIKDGRFFSGKHYNDTWIAKRDETAALRDPDSLTVLNPGYTSLEFEVRTLEGDTMWFDSLSMAGKVTIVEIFGSWCPNCSDETNFFKSLYEKYGAENLNIIPVAFERGDDFEKHRAAVVNYATQFKLPFPAYVGGTSNKSDCGKVFPAIQAIMSYPTSIILDKNGKVRKIHTGFYGPGTGKYHEMYTERIDMFIQQLIAE